MSSSTALQCSTASTAMCISKGYTHRPKQLTLTSAFPPSYTLIYSLLQLLVCAAFDIINDFRPSSSANISTVPIHEIHPFQATAINREGGQMSPGLSLCPSLLIVSHCKLLPFSYSIPSWASLRSVSSCYASASCITRLAKVFSHPKQPQQLHSTISQPLCDQPSHL